MAIMKLGAIVTDAAGSIGGTTLRRGRGNLVVYNKSRGPSLERSYNNPALIKNAHLMNSWGSLSDAEKSSWADAAALFQFPDKFGDLRYLRPRELYIKLQTQLAVTGASNYTNATGIVSTTGDVDMDIPGFIVDGNQFDTADWEYDISSITIDYYIVLAVLRIPVNQNFFPVNKQTPFMVVGPLSGANSDTVDITTELNSHFSNIQAGQKYAFAQWVVNEWGFKSAPVVELLIADEV